MQAAIDTDMQNLSILDMTPPIGNSPTKTNRCILNNNQFIMIGQDIEALTNQKSKILYKQRASNAVIRSLTTVQSVVNREVEYAIKNARQMTTLAQGSEIRESLQEDSNLITSSALGVLANQF